MEEVVVPIRRKVPWASLHASPLLLLLTVMGDVLGKDWGDGQSYQYQCKKCLVHSFLLLSFCPFAYDLPGDFILYIGIEDIPDVIVVKATHGYDTAPQIGLVNDSLDVHDIAVEGVH